MSEQVHEIDEIISELWEYANFRNGHIRFGIAFDAAQLLNHLRSERKERENPKPVIMNTHVGLRTEYETPHSCGNCGEHIAAEWPFCPECGTATGIPVTSSEPNPLTEKEIRARVGEIVTIVSQAAGGTIRVYKCVVDLYDYRDNHCFILWKYGIRASAGNRLSQFERNCLLLPFGELNYSWVAYDHLPAQYIHFPERFIQKEVRPTFWGEPNGGSK